ncbi:unknown [Clostridium sp. CAG:710]|nr:unknown [Clostridium sp. CAG:710]
MNIRDTLNEEIEKINAEKEESEKRIAELQAQIESLSKELEKKRRMTDILKQALANIDALEEEIKETSKEEEIVEEKQPIQEEKDSKLKFNTVQKAKARLCQLGVAVKSKIPTATDIKEKLASAAISAGYMLETTRDNIENFTSELIERFTEKREKYEQKITESKKAKETKRTVEEAQYESDNILNFNPRQPEATKSSKLGIVSKKVIDTLKLTNIDLKIEKAFLEAGISVKNYVEKTTDIINNKVEKIRSIPSNAIEKYQQWQQGRIDKRTELQNQINSLKGMKAQVLNAQDPIAEQLVEQPAKTM